MNLQKLNLRTGVIIGLLVFILTGFLVSLGNTQLVHGKEFAVRSSLTESNGPVPAARGVILDRNGLPLVTNKPSLSMVFEAPLFPPDSQKQERNEIIAALIALFDKSHAEWIDQLPIVLQSDGTFAFVEDRKDSKRDIAELKSQDYLNLNDYATAEDCVTQLIKKYNLEPYDRAMARKIASVHFNMYRLRFDTSNIPYTFAQNVTDELKSKVREDSTVYRGVQTELVSVRSYDYPTLAPHIIGRVGNISKEDYDTHKDDEVPYKLNDEYGAFGIERAAEPYLRGKEGIKKITVDPKGNADIQYAPPPQQGDTVILTIDKTMEEIIQRSFPKYMYEVGNLGNRRFNEIPIAGAVVVMDVRNFEILASVSYPGYNIDNYAADLSALSQDETAPLYNRALQGTYEPGSTIKLSVALAALQEKVIAESSTVRCTGVYHFLNQDFHCPQVYLHSGVNVNVIRAIVDSCNSFFYEMGRRLGFLQMNSYRQSMGLGQKTGVELPERAGVMDSPDYRASIGSQWYAGNNILTAIGQGNLFTPVQMAVYASTVANGGKRYRAHFIRSIRKAGTNEVVKNFGAELLGSTGIDPANYEIVRRGMKLMAESPRSSIRRYFGELPVNVACKTGTSQVYRTVNGRLQKFNHGIFVSFAPYDNPEIAVIAVGEGCKNAIPLVPTVRDVYQYYFGSINQMEKPQAENALL